tara:strand:- start:287 stop:577 length:291 start_codon:yes stop_codon:yes gene_type:complete
MTIREIIELILKNFDEVKNLKDSELYYDRSDFVNQSSDNNDLDIDVYTIQILIEQIRRFKSIVKKNCMNPERKSTVNENFQKYKELLNEIKGEENG